MNDSRFTAILWVLLFLSPVLQEDPLWDEAVFLSSQPADQRKIINALRQGMTLNRANALFDRSEDYSLSSRRVINEILASGPWVINLVDRLLNTDPRGDEAARILTHSLGLRPFLHELPEPNQSENQIIDLFGNSKSGEGVYLLFPTRWPDKVHMMDFLECLNEQVRPECPFVLSPIVAEDPQLILLEKPEEGAAPLVLDRLFRSCGLGVTYLQSLAMVHPNGGSVFDRFKNENKSDELLLKDCLTVMLKSSLSRLEKKAALAALSHLDLPGMFEGAYQKLGEGTAEAYADLLLYGPGFSRLRARLAAQIDDHIILALLKMYDGLKEENPRKEKLFKLLLRADNGIVRRCAKNAGLDKRPWFEFFKASPDLSLPFELLESPLIRDKALGVALACHLSEKHPTLLEAFKSKIFEWKDPSTAGLRLLDRCLYGIPIKDQDCAQLVKNPLTRSWAFQMAPCFGEEKTLDAILELGFAGKIGSVQGMAAAGALIQRLRPEETRKFCFIPHDENGLSQIFRLGLAVYLGLPKKELDKAANDLLQILKNSPPHGKAVIRTFSLFNRGRICSYVGLITEAISRFNRQDLMDEGKNMFLQTAEADGLTSERIRLQLAGDQWEDLKEQLSLLSSMNSIRATPIAIQL